MTPNQAKEVYKNLKQLVELERRREGIAMKLFCHPDATANQVMELQGKLVEARISNRKLYAEVVQKIAPKLPSWYDLGVLKL